MKPLFRTGSSFIQQALISAGMRRMAIVYPKLSGEEITRQGKKHYENLRTQIETAENIGKIISINVEIGDYEIGDDLLISSRQLQASDF